MLGFDGAVNLPQVAQANDQFGFRLDMQQHLDGMQPGAVFIDHGLLVAVLVPSAQKSLHRRRQMGVAAVEGIIELR